MKTRIMAVCLMVVLFLTAFLPVTVSAEYENTYVNTGDQRADIIGVALTQVGYIEEAGGVTKYGRWYGYPDADWCGIFISWCAEQAGVPQSVLKKNGWAKPSGFGFSTYYTSSQYTPKSGDLFFTPNSSGGFSHAGLVYYVEGNYFYTLEGNTWYGGRPHGVYSRQRALSDYVYVSPNYNGSGGNITIPSTPPTNPTTPPAPTTPPCSHKWKDNGIINEAGCTTTGSKSQICEKCGDKKTVSIPSTGGHDFGEWMQLDDKQHQRKCSKCDKVEKKNHDKLEQMTDSAGHWKTCKTCEGHFQMEAHTFEGECGTKCTVCKYASPDGHQFGDWQTDETGHWKVCAACKKEDAHIPHNYPAQCAETCTDCGYIRSAGHTYEQKSDEKGHWLSCTVCGAEEKVKDHIPGPEADEENPQICVKCSFELAPKVEHVHTFVYSFDRLSHWGQCQCGEMEIPQNHQWSFEQGNCSVCGAVAEEAEETIDWDMIWIVGGASLVVITCAIVIVLLCIKKKKD